MKWGRAKSGPPVTSGRQGAPIIRFNEGEFCCVLSGCTDKGKAFLRGVDAGLDGAGLDEGFTG